MYFAYTTLSTVGFGDKVPRSDSERLIGCVILISGVALFGMILGQLTELIDNFKALNEEIDDGNELRKFFECIKAFNHGVDLTVEKKRELENYFQYRWEMNKNSAIDDEEEKD
jgi:hypothetical protein